MFRKMNILTWALCLSMFVISLTVGRSLSRQQLEDDAFAVQHNNDNDNGRKQESLPKPLEIFEQVIKEDIYKKNKDNGERTQKVAFKPLEMFDIPLDHVDRDIIVAGVKRNVLQRYIANLYKRAEKLFWKKNHLTWRLYNFPSSHSPISHEQVVRDIETALGLWSSVTPLVFERRETGDDADLRIFFASKSHGDGYPFDGDKGVAGHAFPPSNGNPMDGDVHLDDDETFTNDGKFGTNFLYVVTHEIGHALGLFHSTDRTSIMQGFVMPGLPLGPSKLPLTDARQIQGLYGSKPGMGKLPPKVPTAAPTSPPPFDCRGGDYAATVIRGSLFLFQNERYWRFNEASLTSELLTSPSGSLIGSYFKDLPDSVESAFTMYNGTTVYTKGNIWYSYNIKQPYNQKDGDPSHIDAAMHDERKQRTYFFRGNDMKKLNHKRNEMSKWVASSTEFEGFPGDISAAFTDEQGNRFFMKQNKYWKYNRKSNTAASDYPKFLPANIC